MLSLTLVASVGQRLASTASQTGYALLSATSRVRLFLLLSLPSHVSRIAIVYCSFYFAKYFIALWSLITSFMRFYYNILPSIIYINVCMYLLIVLIHLSVINDFV